MAAIFTLSCSHFSKDKSAQEEVVIFDDGYVAKETNDSAMVEITDEDFSNSTENSENGAKNGKDVPIRVMSDSSRVETMFDTFGNKSEIRTFNNHPRLSMIVIETSGKGERTVRVYGQNGEVENLPKEMFNKALTAPAQEIADAAKIIKIKVERGRPDYTQIKPQNSEPLQPLPSSEYTIQNPKVENPNPNETNPTGQNDAPASQENNYEEDL